MLKFYEKYTYFEISIQRICLAFGMIKFPKFDASKVLKI